MDNERGVQDSRFRCENSAFIIPHSAFERTAHANPACFCIGVARLRSYLALDATGAVEDRGIDIAHNVSYRIALRDGASRRRRRHSCDYNGDAFNDSVVFSWRDPRLPTWATSMASSSSTVVFRIPHWMKRPYLRAGFCIRALPHGRGSYTSAITKAETRPVGRVYCEKETR